MNETLKRVAGYGLSVIVGGALIYGGFIYKAPPALETMLNSVEIQIGLAGKMADAAGRIRDENGSEVQGVASLLNHAREELDRIEAFYPESSAPNFYRGHLAFLEGRYADAAQLYQQTRSGRDCDTDLGDRSVINQATSLRRAGRAVEGAALIRGHEFQERYADAARRELASMEAAAQPPVTPQK